MTNEDMIQEIRRRMTLEPFTFAQLHAGLPDEAYRIADREIQRQRRKGLIQFERKGRNTFWRSAPPEMPR